MDKKTVSMEKVVLDIVEQRVSARINNRLPQMTNLEIESMVDVVSNDLVIKLQNRVARQQLHREVIEYPSSWWQHFKKDVFPEWLLRKFPVKNEVVVVDAFAFYNKIALPKEDTTVEVRRVDWT